MIALAVDFTREGVDGQGFKLDRVNYIRIKLEQLSL